ncbi:hypothetical protein DV735_g2805, partial [Chaetothyriales sp. CBS 134920]
MGSPFHLSRLTTRAASCWIRTPPISLHALRPFSSTTAIYSSLPPASYSPARPKRIVVGITGATGGPYAIQLLSVLRQLGIQTHLVMSKWAMATMKYETPMTESEIRQLAYTSYAAKDMSAPIASGSFQHDGMIIAPCSMKTLSAVRTGFCDDLISRAADVSIKEGRKLVLVVRETPLSEIHLENMLAARRAGAIIFPPVPAFYTRPANLEEMVQQSVGRMLDALGIHTETFPRWNGFEKPNKDHQGYIESQYPPLLPETREKYTASFAFFEGLYEAGVSHVFVNLGSDHPAIMEALAVGANLKDVKFPEIITCPHEMVAMSMADGFARVTGKPQCVLVHVDVGTQMLGCAMHNASVARCPVIVFAGLSPYTLDGEMRGSRTEYIHWLQDAPDQKAIVSQFCRFAGEFKSGKNIKQVLNRAIQFATSDPKGPSYLMGAREVMEEDITPYKLDQSVWEPISPAGLSPEAIKTTVSTLVAAKEPLIVVGYTGRNHATVPLLVELAELIPGIRVQDGLGSDVCFPFSHRASLGVQIGSSEAVKTADSILIIDCDVPWIPTRCRPREDAKIIHIDVDPLKQNMPLHYVSAFRRFRADSETALRQLTEYIRSQPEYNGLINKEPYATRWSSLAESHSKQLAEFAKQAAPPASLADYPSSSYLCSQLRKQCPKDAIFTVEAVTNAPFVYSQLQVDEPGHLINSGGGGLGWSGGATLGVKLGSDHLAGGPNKGKFVCEIVGDGTYLFGVPGTVYWIAHRYKIPTLTVVLSNKGWNAPRNSLTLVHPNGQAAKGTNEDLHISFAPTPDYSGIARAASGNTAMAAVVSSAQDLLDILPKAVETVKAGTSAILEVRLAGSWEKK